MDWLTSFDERQQKEIKLSRLYYRDFNHGTDGHNAKVIIARMAEMLDEFSSKIHNIVICENCGVGMGITKAYYDNEDVLRCMSCGSVIWEK